MIIGYVGRPRSGKSLNAVIRITDALKSGRVVATNIEGLDDPVCNEVLREICGLSPADFKRQLIFLTKEMASRFWEFDKVVVSPGSEFERSELLPICPPGALICIDEVHKLFSCHDNRTDKNRKFADWASTHGHDGYDVLLITQDILKVESHVRSLIEVTYYFRKVNFFGGMIRKSYLKYTYDGWEHEGKPICNPSRHIYDAHYYGAYKSYSNKAVKEIGIQKNPNILNQPIFYAIPCVLAFFLYFLLTKSSFATGDLFGTKKNQVRHTQAVAAATNPSAPKTELQKLNVSTVPDIPKPVIQARVSSARHVQAVASASPVVDKVCHVTGYVSTDKGYICLLSDGRHVVTKKPLEINSHYDK